MLFLANFDPNVGLLSIMAVLAILIGFLLKRIKQPYIIGYIIIGVVMGQQGLGLIENTEVIHQFGEIGIILLLFFIGMEINLPDFVKQWRLAVIGTLLQVGISILILLAIGYFFNWQTARSIVLGFVIALSSSAVIIKLLEDKQLINKRIGRNVLSILLTQDIIIVPLLIITAQLGGDPKPYSEILLMIVGGLVIVAILGYIYVEKEIRLPFYQRVQNDHEIQVFLAILLCFGGALITSLFGLSPALGAFVGGMVMHASGSCTWIHDTLRSFRVLFVAFFFISIGLQLDLGFIGENLASISLVLVSVYITNHLLNALILRLFDCTWREAFLGGALLAQIGELSFLITSLAFGLGIIMEFGYKFTISLISLTLFISPFWILLAEKLLEVKGRKPATVS